MIIKNVRGDAYRVKNVNKTPNFKVASLLILIA